jgi:hypothetical protein
MKRLAFPLPLILVLLAGCASTDSVILDSSHRAPTTNVDVYKVGEKPKRAFKEIARLSFLGPREDEFKALRHFVSEAKKLGAGGILLEPTEDGGMRTVYGGRLTTTFVFKATAIAYE